MLSSWSCPSASVRPVPERPRTSAVTERLAVVAARRADATAAWEAWCKQHVHRRKVVEAKKERGAALPPAKQDAWRRARAQQVRSRRQQRASVERELRARAEQHEEMRTMRHEARVAANNAAARLRRLQDNKDDALRAHKLYTWSRQLAQLIELEQSPLARNGSLPKIAPDSVLEVRRRQAASFRRDPKALVSRFKQKRDMYLGARVVAASDSLLVRRKPLVFAPVAAPSLEAAASLEEATPPPVAQAPRLADNEETQGVPDDENDSYDDDENYDDDDAPPPGELAALEQRPPYEEADYADDFDNTGGSPSQGATVNEGKVPPYEDVVRLETPPAFDEEDLLPNDDDLLNDDDDDESSHYEPDFVAGSSHGD